MIDRSAASQRHRSVALRRDVPASTSRSAPNDHRANVPPGVARRLHASKDSRCARSDWRLLGTSYRRCGCQIPSPTLGSIHASAPLAWTCPGHRTRTDHRAWRPGQRTRTRHRAWRGQRTRTRHRAWRPGHRTRTRHRAWRPGHRTRTRHRAWRPGHRTRTRHRAWRPGHRTRTRHRAWRPGHRTRTRHRAWRPGHRTRPVKAVRRCVVLDLL